MLVDGMPPPAVSLTTHVDCNSPSNLVDEFQGSLHAPHTPIKLLAVTGGGAGRGQQQRGAARPVAAASVATTRSPRANAGNRMVTGARSQARTTSAKAARPQATKPSAVVPVPVVPSAALSLGAAAPATAITATARPGPLVPRHVAGATATATAHQSGRRSGSAPARGRVVTARASAVAVVDGAMGLDIDVSAFDDEEHDEEDDPNETAEEKRLKRMKRNRESAAMSRNRKKQYVEELEAQLASLSNAVHTLTSENHELRRECVRMGGAPLPSTTVIPASIAPAEAAMLPVALPLAHPEDEMPSLEEGILSVADLSSELIEPMLAPLAPAPTSEPPLPTLPVTATATPVRPTTTVAAKRAGSPLLGGGAKRASAASLAFMSAVTLVTLSVSASGRMHMADASTGAVRHAPGARMLMSLTEAVMPWTPSGAGEPLWPSIGVAPGSHAEKSASSTPVHHLPPAEARGYAERVIRAPQNSSWADVLRIEAAEKQLAEAQLALRALRESGHLGAADHSAAVARPIEHAEAVAEHASALAAHQRLVAPPRPLSSEAKASAAFGGSATDRPPVFEHVESEDELDTTAQQYEAERYIFCSRTYMFDAPVLPTSTPSRFRHPAAFPRSAAYTPDGRLPQISDGRNESSPEAGSKPPVFNLLLPSAALQGVVAPDVRGGAASNSDLTQVQCQVLNSSRFTASPQ
jgi:hypothetical protein